MSEQLSLPGFESVTSNFIRPTNVLRRVWPRHNVFFALLPSAEAGVEIARVAAQLSQSLGIGGKAVSVDRLHISLRGVGGYLDVPPPEVVRTARFIGDAVAASADAFDIVFDHAMSFRNAAAFVLCVGEGLEEVKALRFRLGLAIANAGGPNKANAFSPHMTLSYRGKVAQTHAIAPLRWTASTLALIDSHVGESHYEVMGSWSLRR
ncbi:2'-5' RNA ligase family protein [Rhodoferax sp. GW822-FHT02A01]|uniref:2'-5' RNA ligase family protein n=1 Tax=Rhodoferax sp. GW822-FHT02A01 TaxID=3141537 RepID=UPI00315C74FA